MVLSLKRKIAQMLIFGFNGSELTETSPIAHWLQRDGLGGVILFNYDCKTKSYEKNIIDSTQVKRLVNQLHHYNVSAKKLFIAIDYEGGVVDRLSRLEDCMNTLSPKAMAELSQEDYADELAQMADTLRDLGFNLNFAPLVDLDLNDKEGIIGKLGRSFSADPEVVSRKARVFVEAFYDKGIASCYKHFPGHGSAVGDTHEGFVDVTETFESKELIPYKTLAGMGNLPVMVMTAHVINRNLDPSGLPATLSHKILQKLLREELGYEGVIISDDLQMQAIASHYDLDESLKLTINAGADMLIFANQLDYIEAPEVIDRIEQLVLQEKISLDRIDQAYGRIVRLKKLMQV